MYIAIQCFPGLSCGSVLQIIRIGPSEFDHVGRRSQANTPTNIRVHLGSFRSIDSILFPFIFSPCSQKARSSSDQSPNFSNSANAMTFIVLGKAWANFMSSRTLPCLSKLKCSPDRQSGRTHTMHIHQQNPLCLSDFLHPESTFQCR